MKEHKMNPGLAFRRLRKYFVMLACGTFLYFVLMIDTVDIPDILKEERELLVDEMEGYQFPMNSMNPKHNYGFTGSDSPQMNSQPISIIIFSTWRSGSTFFGQIFNAHPAIYYHYEPLHDFGAKQIEGEAEESQAVEKLKALLHCNYTELGDNYLKYMEANSWMFMQNTRLWTQCRRHPRLCWRTEFLNPFCKLFPFHVMKLVRMRLRVAENLITDPTLNVRALLLVRDPRGTYLSRKELKWCREDSKCIDPELLCENLVQDYEASKILSEKYPDRFRIVLYEELSTLPLQVMQNLTKFIGFSFHPNMQQYLDGHTMSSWKGWGDVTSTYRNSKAVAYRWRKYLSENEIQWLEDKCAAALQNWDYPFIT